MIYVRLKPGMRTHLVWFFWAGAMQVQSNINVVAVYIDKTKCVILW